MRNDGMILNGELESLWKWPGPIFKSFCAWGWGKRHQYSWSDPDLNWRPPNTRRTFNHYITVFGLQFW